MAFDIGPYQVRDTLHQGREVSVYRAVRRADGVPFVAKVPNDVRPQPAILARFDNEARILRPLDGATRCRRLASSETYGSGTALFFAAREGMTLGGHLAGLKLPIDEFLRL